MAQILETTSTAKEPIMEEKVLRFIKSHRYVTNKALQNKFPNYTKNGLLNIIDKLVLNNLIQKSKTSGIWFYNAI